MPLTGLVRQLSLLTRFTLTGLTMTALIAAILGWALARELERSALDREARSQADAVTRVLDPFLQTSDFAEALSGQRLADLDRIVRERILQAHAVRVKLWGPSGLIVYSTDPELMGQEFAVEHELAEALDGHLATEVSDLSKAENEAERQGYARLMEIYVPVRLDGRVVGVYELYHDLDAVQPGIVAMQRLLWLSLAAAFGILYLALFGLVARASRELGRQSQELARLEARREIDRLKGEFVSIVSHELRTPLASLVGYSELLLRRQANAVEQREWLETIRSEAFRLNHLVEELLDVSKIEAGRVDLRTCPLQLETVTRCALATFRTQANGHRFDQRVPTELPPVLADPDKLTQVLTNLVSNAIKYSPNGGVVTIGAEAANGSIRLSVADRGLGIPPDELPHLFDRFHRVHDEARAAIPGTGLGLYITKQLVELLGGRVWAESPGPGQGSTFYVELPIADVANLSN